MNLRLLVYKPASGIRAAHTDGAQTKESHRHQFSPALWKITEGEEIEAADASSWSLGTNVVLL